MINIDIYIPNLIESLKNQFGARLLYVGLQGSYLRGEATDHSDIDIMIIIDELGVDDLRNYRRVIQSMEHFDKSCGFICSRTDLKNWNPLEIHHLLNTTKDYYGTLQGLTPAYTEQDVRHFVKMSINNLYHEICHRYVHAQCNSNITALTGSYKSVFFILQNLHYLRSGSHIQTKAELVTALKGKDHAVLKRSLELNSGVPHDFHESFELLLSWCQETLQAV